MSLLSPYDGMCRFGFPGLQPFDLFKPVTCPSQELPSWHEKLGRNSTASRTVDTSQSGLPDCSSRTGPGPDSMPVRNAVRPFWPACITPYKNDA